MEYYMDDENWRVSSSSNNAYNSTKSSSSLPRSVSQKCPSSKSTTSRASLYKTSSLNTPLPRSSSQRSPFTKIPPLPRSSSQKCANFGRKCSSLAKEQKAKFYIVKRCITMLVSWNKHGDS